MAKTENPPKVDTIEGNKMLEMINAPEDSVKSVKRLTPLQRAGMQLAAGVGIVGFIVILGLVYFWLSHSPSMPALPTDMTNINSETISNTKSILDHYKTASDMAIEGASKMFDIVVVKVLLPLFSLILGYVFGTGRAAAAEENDS